MVVMDSESTDVIVAILIEFQNHFQNGNSLEVNSFGSYPNPAFLGISVWVARVPVGFNEAEIIQRIGKIEKMIRKHRNDQANPNADPALEAGRMYWSR